MISNKIESLRKEKKIIQTHLANSLGITLRAYQIAIKNNDLKISTLEKIAQALEVPITYFFEDSGDKYFLSEIFLACKGNTNTEVRKSIEEIISIYILRQYEKYFYDDIDIQKLITETFKKEYEEFCEKLPLDRRPTPRTCSVFFGVNIYFNTFNDFPIDDRHEIISTINRVNSEFFVVIKENKSISWLLKNDVISEANLLKIVNDISLDYKKRETEFWGEFIEKK